MSSWALNSALPEYVLVGNSALFRMLPTYPRRAGSILDYSPDVEVSHMLAVWSVTDSDGDMVLLLISSTYKAWLSMYSVPPPSRGPGDRKCRWFTSYGSDAGPDIFSNLEGGGVCRFLSEDLRLGMLFRENDSAGIARGQLSKMLGIYLPSPA